MIEYIVSASNPHAHLFNISLRVERPKPVGQCFSMPNWIPGSYFIRDFARHVVSLEAYSDNGEAVSVQKTNSNTWQCGACAGALTVKYEIYAFDPSIRGAHLDGEHAFFNGSCLFLQVEDHDGPCKIKIYPPNLPQAQAWRVATTLQRDSAPLWGYGGYQAANYEELIDHPVEIGNFVVEEFTIAGIPHKIVVSGKQEGDIARLAKDVNKICQVHIELFGDPPPFQEYLFLLTVLKEGYGGLEHRSSCALIIQRDALPIQEDLSYSRGYINLLGLFSHEYFHAWNVKRIKPSCFMAPNLNEKVYTEQLWAFEGITSYYDELALVRAKILDLHQYVDLLAESITKYIRNIGHTKQTIAQSSFDAWIKFYQPNENSANATVNYYIKGSLIALIIDLNLRIQSASLSKKISLDDVMKHLWQQFGAKNIGVPEGYIEKIINEISQQDLSSWLNELLYTTKDLPLVEILEQFGLNLRFRVAYEADDMGGKKSNMLFNASGGWGCTIVKNQGKAIVSYIQSKSPAEEAGLSVHDEIIAINDFRVDADSFEKIAKRLKPGKGVDVTLFRQDILKRIPLTLQLRIKDTAEIHVKEKQSEIEKDNIQAWLFL